MRLSVFLIGVLVTSVAQAWDTPRQAIDEFLKFELAGGRLSSWPFDKYLAVGTDYDEPGWDELELVDGAKVLSLTCRNVRCEARVKFSFTPTKQLSHDQIAQHPAGGDEIVTYAVVQRSGHWLLENSEGRPRVSYAAFKRLRH